MILLYEEMMLEVLTFDLMIENPFNFLFHILKDLGMDRNKRLLHAAWAFCSDASLTTLCLVMDTRDIALSAIFFASTYSREPINDIDGEPWWKKLNVNEKNLNKAIDIMREFYTENPLRKDNPYHGSPEFSLENTRKRGGTAGALSQGGETVSSTVGTPMVQTPMSANNTQPTMMTIATDGCGTGTNWSESQTVVGDSDTGLKAAANEMETHATTAPVRPEPNGPIPGAHNSASPGAGIKRSVEPDDEADERSPKRKRSEESMQG